MKSLKVSIADLEIEDYEIEEHVARHNRFFKKSELTLQDLHTYAKPFTDVLNAALSLARGEATAEQATKTLRNAAERLRKIELAIEEECVA